MLLNYKYYFIATSTKTLLEPDSPMMGMQEWPCSPMRMVGAPVPIPFRMDLLNL